jgi:hypothetical protein
MAAGYHNPTGDDRLERLRVPGPEIYPRAVVWYDIDDFKFEI